MRKSALFLNHFQSVNNFKLFELLTVFAECIAVSGCADADTLITKEDVQLKQLITQQLKQKLEEEEK